MADKKEIKNITTRNWSYDSIEYWINPKDRHSNATIIFDGKKSRLRAGILIVKNDEILLGEELDQPGEFSLPGGGLEKDETPIDAAKREAQEEVFINVKNAKDTEYDYCETHTEVSKWVKNNVPEKNWWYNYYTCLIIAEYDSDYFGDIDKIDLDKSMNSTSRWYRIKDVINKPTFKEQWKKALIDFGYYKSDSTTFLTEQSINSNIYNKIVNYFKISDVPVSGPTFILPTGQFIDLVASFENLKNNVIYKNYPFAHHELLNTFLKEILKVDFDYTKLALIKCNNGEIEHYFGATIAINLKTYPTTNQYTALRQWIDVWCFRYSNNLTVRSYDSNQEWECDDTTKTTYIINKIKYFYNQGILKEDLKDKTKETSWLNREKERVADVINQIKDIKYGFISKINGKIIDDRDWIHNCQNIYHYYDVELDPEVTLKRKLGICQDQAIVIKYLMNKFHPEDCVKLYSLVKEPKGHCVACYCHNSQWYYLENAWDKEMGLHGPFDSEDDVKNYLANLYYKHHKDDTPKENEVVIDDYHIGLQEAYNEIYDTIDVYVSNLRDGGGWLQEIPVINSDITKSINDYRRSLGWNSYSVEYRGPNKTHKNTAIQKPKKQKEKNYKQLSLFDDEEENSNFEQISILDDLNDELQEKLVKDDKTVIAYHSSTKKFDKFDIEKVNTGHNDGGAYGPGLYFGESPEFAKMWNSKGYVYKVELTFENPYVCNNDEDREKLAKLIKSQIIDDDPDVEYFTGRNINDMTDFFAQGYDSIISNNEEWESDTETEIHNQYVAFKNDQIKILDIMEYDNSLNEKIIKKGSKWQVQSKKGRNMGTYDTKDKAKKRLRQIEYFKHLNEDNQKDYKQKFIERTTKHIKLVNDYAKKLNKSFPDHDKDKLDKLLDNYYLCYLRYNNIPLTDKEEKRLDKATLEHITTNRHHPEYWTHDKLDDFSRNNPPKELEADDMDEEALIEMCCDWCAVSQEMKNTPFEWFSKVIPERWAFNSKQKDFILSILNQIWENNDKDSKYLTEDTRNKLINDSRNVDNYKNQKYGKNRFERKRLSKILNQVKMFNDLDMNMLVKQDTLLIHIPVQGETNQYTVSLQMEGAMTEIKNNVKLNNNKFEYKNVVQAVTKIFNSSNIKVKCTCDDFKYKYSHNLIINNNSIDDTSKDPGPGKTGVTAQMKGQGCKHILLVLSNQDWIMKLSSVVSNYIKYMAVNQKDLFLRVIFPKLYGVDKDSAVENNLVQNDEMLNSSKDIIDTINKWSVNKGRFKKESNKNTEE